MKLLLSSSEYKGIKEVASIIMNINVRVCSNRGWLFENALFKCLGCYGIKTFRL